MNQKASALRLCGWLLICTTVLGCRARTHSDSVSAADDAWGNQYLGHSDYRLLLAGSPGPDFNPNQDLLRPTPAELARQQVAAALHRAAFSSILPIMGQIQAGGRDTEGALFDGLMALADAARKTLQQELRPMLANAAAKFPLVSEAWLVPWTEPAGEVFYDANKISLSPAEAANVLRAVPGSAAFAQKLAERIQILRSKLRAEADTAAYPLAARYVLFVAPKQSTLTIRILVGLKPHQGPFEKADDKVKFRRVVVPDVPGKGVTAALTISVPLDREEAPELKVAFGDFVGMDAGNFAMSSNTIAQTAPRLEGEANKRGTGWVALNFAFQELQFNLRTVQLEQLSTIVSPGLKVGSARWTVGGIRAASVDQAFQAEINRTIDGELKSALERGNDQILSGLLTRDLLELAFQTIFQRE